MDAAFPTQSVTGLLLCHVAQNRFAFLAEHVSSIEAYRSDGAPHASKIYDLENISGTAGKILRHASGAGVGVDSVEVLSDDVPLLPSPRLMLAGVGGSLYGFVSLADGLYPVLRLSEFARYLASHASGTKP